MIINNPQLLSSKSKQYRDSAIFLQQHGLIDVLSIDANIKNSRQNNDPNIYISWADIDTYNNSHMINDSFITRKINIKNTKINPSSSVSIRLQKIPLFIRIRNYIKNFPIFSFILFVLFLLIIPGTIGKIFLWIEIIWMSLSIIYFIQRFVKYMYSLISVKYALYGDIKVYYGNRDDLSLINSQFIKTLEQLFKDFDVLDIVLYNNNIYIKQPNQILPTTILWLADNILTKKYKTEEEKEKLVNETFQVINSQEFINLFMQ